MRNFILSTCLVFGCCYYSFGQFVNPMFVPDTLIGNTFNLAVGKSKKVFIGTDSTDTYGINGDYLGPTMIFNKGDFINLNVTNNLGETTTMHWHGMHVAPHDDGGPHTPILDGETWSPDFTVLDEATTFWYHPHLHHKTAEQVYNGAAGMIIVRDNNPIANQLPHTYGVDEFPLIIQDKSFDTTGAFTFTELADTMMINGTLGAYLDVPAQMVRFHLLNASNQRVYNIGFPSQFPAYQIGSDGGLLESPVSVNRTLLSPGERAEIVVDFSNKIGQMGRVTSHNSEMVDGISGGPKGPKGRPNNPLDGLDFQIIEFRVQTATTNAITSLPNTLNTLTRPNVADADKFRTKVFTADTSGFPFYINGTLMDMSVINDSVKLDDIEVWTLINSTEEAHPWHIHDIQFFILDINGTPPPPTLRGLKDVILTVPGDTIRYITQFTDFADDTIPYMYHCHNLFHEDAGMMGQFIVQEEPVSIFNPEDLKWDNIQTFPNPSGDFIQVDFHNSNNQTVGYQVINYNGKKVLEGDFDSVNHIDIRELSVGTYILKLKSSLNEVTAKFVKQ